MSLAEVHARLANTTLFYFIILGVWSVWRAIRKQGLESNYWGALAIAEILIVIQGLLGSYLWIIGLRPGRPLHLLYGIAGALVIPGLFAYTKGDKSHRAMIIYAVAILFAVGLILRGIATGVPVPAG